MDICCSTLHGKPYKTKAKNLQKENITESSKQTSSILLLTYDCHIASVLNRLPVSVTYILYSKTNMCVYVCVCVRVHTNINLYVLYSHVHYNTHESESEFSRPEYRSGLPFPSPGPLSNPGIEPRSPALPVDSLPAEPQGNPNISGSRLYLSLNFII